MLCRWLGWAPECQQHPLCNSAKWPGHDVDAVIMRFFFKAVGLEGTITFLQPILMILEEASSSGVLHGCLIGATLAQEIVCLWVETLPGAAAPQCYRPLAIL